MLLSTLISVIATNKAPILGTLGRPAQAWFLNQVMKSSSKLAGELHDSNSVKPLTVSTLLDHNGRPLEAGDWLKPGQEYWLRVTSLSDALSEILLTDVLPKLPKRMELYKMEFRVDGFTLNSAQHPWAAQTTFQEMAQDQQYAQAQSACRMEFVSPTAFRSNGNDIALPMPGQVFRSLGQKWNAFCPASMRLHELWPGFAEACILVDELTAVNSVYWEFAEGTRGTATGYTGTVGFRIPARNRVDTAWQPYWSGAAVVMQSLARFALYAGVGHHTTIGMGQTRVVPSKVDLAHMPMAAQHTERR